MGGYLAYTEYKDSGIEWLGKIPSHWKLLKIKRLTMVKRGASPRPIDDPKYFDDDGEYSWVRIADVTASDRYLELTTQRLSELGRSLSVPLEPGEIFLSIAGSVGKPIITKIKCCIHDGFVYFPMLQENHEFLYYLFSSGQPYLGLGKLGTQLNLNTDTVGGIYIGLPLRPEQQQIAAFLDYKTAQIDALIAKKEALLEKLAEKRTALISQAVTKGLDPTVPMKDSGIEWLGEIPKHWEILALKRLAQVRGGVTKGRKLNDLETIELPYLRVANVQDGHVDITDMATIEILVDELARYSLKAGDVLMNEGGDNDKLGRGTVWHGEIKPCLHQNHVFAVRPHDSATSDWIALISSSSYAKFYFFSKAKQSTNLASISATNIKSLPVVLPPAQEREEILQHLNFQDKEIDAAVSHISNAVDKLKEYRTALITNAVTGKIDVRDIKLPEPTQLEAA